MRKKNIIGILFLLVLAVGVGYLGWTTFIPKSQVPLSGTVIYPQPVSKPSIAPTNEIINSPKYIGSLPVTQLPTEVPVYKINKPIDIATEANRLAVVFGFTGAPQIETTTRGTFYTFSRNNIQLSVGNDPIEVAFINPAESAQIPGPVDGTEYDRLAQEFIKKLALIPPGVSLSEPKIEYFVVDKTPGHLEVSAASRANIIQLTYQIMAKDVPIADNSPLGASFTFQYDSQKHLNSFSGRYNSQIEMTDQVIQIASLSELARRIENGEGTLISVTPIIQGDYAVLNYSLGQIQPTAATLEYFADKDQGILVPVLRVTGIATDTRTRQQVETTTILPIAK